MMRPLVSLPQKQFIAILVGVCVLSAGIGSGLALLAETGPEDLESRVEELESELSGLDGVAEELCGEVFEESC